MKLPRDSFARKIIRLQGWSPEEMAAEVASIDGVSIEEAERRVEAAIRQRRNRSVGQKMVHLTKRRQEEWRREKARALVLAIARDNGRFLCCSDLTRVALEAEYHGLDTGRVMREVMIPMEREGLLRELWDEEDRFIGYCLTESGKHTVNYMMQNK